MLRLSADAILLDIEGTVAPIAFVYDVLFPYARTHLADFLAAHWNETSLVEARRQIITDARSATHLVEDSPSDLQAEILRLMDADAKQPGLKQLQGLVWDEGYRLGRLQSELFSDVAPALRQWHAAGKTLAIYSSGSIAAQRVFFRYTNAGDLTPLLSQFFDTTTGAKRSPDSYVKIAAGLKLAPGRILFCSDVPEELDAASRSGCRVALTIRPGNARVSSDISIPRVVSFVELMLA